MYSFILKFLIELLQKRITWIISTVLLLCVLFYLIFGSPVDTKPYENRINQLESKIENLQQRDYILSLEVDSLKVIETSLINQNEALKFEINEIQSDYTEQIDRINDSSVDDLTEFFTNRYRHLLRSTP